MRLLTCEELLQPYKVPLIEITMQLQEQVQALTKRVEELESQLHKKTAGTVCSAPLPKPIKARLLSPQSNRQDQGC